MRSGEARSLVTTAPTKEDIVRSIVILCMLFGMFGTAGYVFLHDKKVIAAKREQRIAAIWDSGNFQRSLEWLHLAMASDGKESDLPRSAPAQTAQERDAERARTLAVQHEKTKQQLDALISPTWKHSLSDFHVSLRHEHAIFVVLSPSHASIERAPIVLLRTISLLLASAIKFVFMDPAACEEWLSTVSSGDGIQLIHQFFIAMMQTLLVSRDCALVFAPSSDSHTASTARRPSFSFLHSSTCCRIT